MQYVKKPIPIHAQQIVIGANIESWLDPYRMSEELSARKFSIELEFHEDIYLMKTKHGLVEAKPGDWILQAADGEIYPCSDEVFQATYTPAPSYGPGKHPYFPHGQLPGVIPLLIVLRSDGLIAKVAPYFPIPGAMFIGQGARVGGCQFAAAVTLGCSATSEFERWAYEVLQTRMAPGAPEILHL